MQMLLTQVLCLLAIRKTKSEPENCSIANTVICKQERVTKTEASEILKLYKKQGPKYLITLFSADCNKNVSAFIQIFSFLRHNIAAIMKEALQTHNKSKSKTTNSPAMSASQSKSIRKEICMVSFRHPSMCPALQLVTIMLLWFVTCCEPVWSDL